MALRTLWQRWKQASKQDIVLIFIESGVTKQLRRFLIFKIGALAIGSIYILSRLKIQLSCSLFCLPVFDRLLGENSHRDAILRCSLFDNRRVERQWCRSCDALLIIKGLSFGCVNLIIFR